jgi:hypothetical protein
MSMSSLLSKWLSPAGTSNPNSPSNEVDEVGNTAAADNSTSDFWSYFRGKPNSAAVLEEKAGVVAHLIIKQCNAPLLVAEAVKPDFWPSEEEENRALTETAALMLRVVGERATIVLNNTADRDIFMDALTSGVFQALKDNGVMSDELQEFLIKRYDEYNEIRKWLPEKGEGAKGTLFWEFGKNVADPLGVGRDISFQAALSNMLLKSLATWQLDHLLMCVPKT